eukprot:SM000086S23025  [mRNA]  locus=s86:100635:101718:+ [translate_table: standard]
MTSGPAQTVPLLAGPHMVQRQDLEDAGKNCADQQHEVLARTRQESDEDRSAVHVSSLVSFWEGQTTNGSSKFKPGLLASVDSLQPLISDWERRAEADTAVKKSSATSLPARTSSNAKVLKHSLAGFGSIEILAPQPKLPSAIASFATAEQCISGGAEKKLDLAETGSGPRAGEGTRNTVSSRKAAGRGQLGNLQTDIEMSQEEGCSLNKEVTPLTARNAEATSAPTLEYMDGAEGAEHEDKEEPVTLLSRILQCCDTPLFGLKWQRPRRKRVLQFY